MLHISLKIKLIVYHGKSKYGLCRQIDLLYYIQHNIPKTIKYSHNDLNSPGNLYIYRYSKRCKTLEEKITEV